MAEVYTAQEMRDKATELQERADEILRDAVEEGGCTYKPLCKADAREIETIANMLRQAADAKERDEKREKMYEVKGMVMKKNVAIWCSSTYDNVTDARGDAEQYGPKGKVVVLRRSVGEWEEVS